MLNNQAVGDKLPEVFDGKILHPVFFFNVIELSVTAVAGYNHHFSACRLYLIDFSFTVKYPFRIVTGCECASAATAA
jgi:hypothetical protein